MLFRILELNAALLCAVLLIWTLAGTAWTRFDFQALDRVFRYAVSHGKRLPVSNRIVCVLITDKTYAVIGQNRLDRAYLSELNAILAEVAPESVAYDIIFAYPSAPKADQQFADSLSALERVSLPILLEPSEHQLTRDERRGAVFHDLADTGGLKNPQEQGEGHFVYASRAFPQLPIFAKAAGGTIGHVTAPSDADGVYRHYLMLMKVDDGYVPALSLAVFLDYVGVSLSDVVVQWGREIRIPSAKSRRLDNDVVIPIDRQGRAFIPFPDFWGREFAYVNVHEIVNRFSNILLQGNVVDGLNGKLVFVGDVSQGISDAGQTTLEENVPLVALHTALMNGMLTNTFYRSWSFRQAVLLLSILSAVMALVSLLKPAWPLYLAGVVIMVGLPTFTWQQFLDFRLFPIVTVGSSVMFLFVGLVIGLEVIVSKQHAFICRAFARYVPKTVVQQLLDHPEKLQLVGEERRITILFSDVQEFTSIAEARSPKELVKLLNIYLTEMTTIILEEGGTIDKFLGDAIMAEFGAPLPMPDHADRAVAAALRMQHKLAELRPEWQSQGWPELHCRIGINTGKVVIGNMGSHDVFDYTVIGDEANLASRLEGANKPYNTYLMISEATHNALTPGRFQTRVLDMITVKGKTRPVKVFEVYGDASTPVAEESLAYYQAYQQGFDAYLTRHFAPALEHFQQALELRPGDPAAAWLISRIHALTTEALPDDWTGAVALTSK